MVVLGYTLIPMKVITPSITCWVVKAQVSRLWKTIEHANGDAIGRFEMILFDSHV